MKNQKIIIAFLLLAVSLTGWHCAQVGDSIGEGDQIIVFADSLDWPVYEEPLNAIFGKFVDTPIPEHEFLLTWKPYRELEHYKKYKNIFILGRLNSDEPVSANVKDLLNDEIVAGVKSGKYFYIPKYDPWALNQYLLIMVGTSQDDLVQKIYDLGNLAYENFRHYYFTRLKKEMFKRGEQSKLESYISDHFPFKIRVQHDYFIADDNPAEQYLWLRRFYPDRSILIHWAPAPDNFELTSRWLIDQRNKLAAKLFEGDVVVEDETKAYSVKFKDWPAIRLEGVWRNDKYMIGGPFRTIGFVDRDHDRVYMLDFYVQAIGKRKKPYLDQLDVLIHTFELDKGSKD